MEHQGGQRRDAVANRQAVIDAAAVVLTENPDAGIAEIAEHTGLGRTTVYRHFANREALFEGLVEEVLSKGAPGSKRRSRETPTSMSCSMRSRR